MPYQPAHYKFIKATAFQPPAAETLGIALLLAVQTTCFLGTIQVTLLELVGPALWPEAVWLSLPVFVVFVAGFYWGLLQSGVYWSAFRATLVVELAVLILLWRLITLPFGATSLLNETFIGDTVFLATSWVLSRSAARAYVGLFLHFYELRKIKDVSATQDSQALVERYELYQSFQLRLAGPFVAELIILGIGLAINAQYTEGKNYLAGLLWWLLGFGTVYLLVRLPLAVWSRLRYLRAGWQTNQLTEPVGIARRWLSYLVALVGLAVLLSLPVFGLALLARSTLPPVDLSKIPLPNFHIQAPPPPTPVPSQLIPPTGGQPDYTPPDPAPAWLGALLLGIGFMMFLIVMWALAVGLTEWLAGAGWIDPRWRDLAFKRWWRNLWAWLGQWWQPLPPKTELEKPVLTGPAAKDKPRRQFWSLAGLRPPGSPRAQVQFYYERLVERARRAGLPRRRTQTPQEYAGYLTPKLDDAELPPKLDDLTHLYEEARFSPHPVSPDEAEQSRQASQPLLDYLRRKRRK